MGFIIDREFYTESEAIEKEYTKGEKIIEEGNNAPYFFYLLEGELTVFNFSEDGKEFIQHKIIPGNFFGEPAVLLEKTFPGTIEVHSEAATILKIENKKFISYLLNHPHQMLEFTKSIARKAIIKTDNLKNMIFLNPEDRLMKNFVEFKKANGNGEQKILIKMTRQELANLTGLRIETVIRTIKKMEKEEKLTIKRGKIYF
ncbi:Crp/Fnr family transcriptional regulator [Halpernia sp.]|uniref:Crp/Fnr family transcriptional regulator n=1 Tax=Halpernia sp. TaxID=2782209 RepID=UPI003A93A28B